MNLPSTTTTYQAARHTHNITCGLCHNDHTVYMCKMPDDSGQVITLFLCPICGALTPDYVSEKRGIHTEDQTSYYENKWSEDDANSMEKIAEDFRHVVHFYQERTLLPLPSANPAITEIGCGRGALLEALRREGYSPSGSEPSAGLIHLSRKYYNTPEDMLTCADAQQHIAQLHKNNQKLDAIFMWHVIEHITSPIILLRELASLLSPQGVIIMQAPLPLPSSIFPEHLYLLTPATVFHIARMSGLRLCFYDISHAEQFISFALCALESHHAALPEPELDDIGYWIHSLHTGIGIFSALADSRSQTISDMDKHIHLIENAFAETDRAYKALLSNPKFLFKHLIKQTWFTLTRKNHG